MEGVFRVCVSGRYYDIPLQEISPLTLEALKEITDSSNNINPRDLLRAFLESQEVKVILQEAMQGASQKVSQEIAKLEREESKCPSAL